MFIVTIVEVVTSLTKCSSSYKYMTFKPKVSNTGIREDTKGVIKGCKSLMDRQYNGQQKHQICVV